MFLSQRMVSHSNHRKIARIFLDEKGPSACSTGPAHQVGLENSSTRVICTSVKYACVFLIGTAYASSVSKTNVNRYVVSVHWGVRRMWSSRVSGLGPAWKTLSSSYPGLFRFPQNTVCSIPVTESQYGMS